MTPPITTDAHGPHLDIHVLNAGIGESIIVHMPNDLWGVVDCYAASPDDPKTNPTWMFLHEHQVRELEFLCLTHPHADHYRGMSKLFETFQPKFFWQFPVLTRENLLDIFRFLQLEVDTLNKDKDGQESVNDLHKTMRLVNERIKSGDTLFLKNMSDIKPLYPIPISNSDTLSTVKIHSISPSSGHAHRYHETLGRSFRPGNQLRPKRPTIRHNDVSAALVIEYGLTRVVLGGDVEESNWNDTLANLAAENLAAHAVKVSHHGSPTGYNDQLWSIFALQGRPIAIITPSRGHNLPKEEAVKHIRQYAGRIFATCRSAIQFDVSSSTGDQQVDTSESGSSNSIEQLALKTVFSSFRTNRMGKWGICSLRFDDQGNCNVLPCVGDAGPI